MKKINDTHTSPSFDVRTLRIVIAFATQFYYQSDKFYAYAENLQASLVSLVYGGFLYCECDALDSRAEVAVEVLQYAEGADGGGFGAEYART